MNDKVKAIFFAQYLNQKVYTCKDWECFNDKSLNEVDPIYLQCGSNRLAHGYLLLRSINGLTDGEILTIAKIVYPTGDTTDLKCFKVGLAIISDIKHNFGCGAITWGQVDCIRTYLISIGIALPFTFLNDQNQPETYSVEKLVEMGWLTIKPNN